LELGYLRTKEGSALLATALDDDIIAILLVSLAIAVTGPSQAADAGSLVGIIARMALYLVIALLLAWIVVPRVMNWIADQPRLAQSYGLLAIGFTLMLVFAWTAEEFGGVAAITGAFIAGVGLSRTHERTKHQVEDAARSIAYGLLVPIFFVDVGLRTNLSTFPLSALPLALLLLLAGVASKVVGCGLGARLGGFSSTEALRVGVCMISRGEVGLIIAALAVSSGVLSADDPLFSSLFLVILLTTLVTPPLVRWVFREPQTPAPPIEPPVPEGVQVS
jgi:Kef-type K+ transport system membrane component KefB